MTVRHIGPFEIRKEDGGWICDQVGHWFYDFYQAESYIDELEVLLDMYVGRGKWDTVDGIDFDGFKVIKNGNLVGYFPLNTSLDSFPNALNKKERESIDNEDPLRNAFSKMESLD